MASDRRMGPKDMEEIGEEEIFDDFAEALQLRPLERRCEFTVRISIGQDGWHMDRTTQVGDM